MTPTDPEVAVLAARAGAAVALDSWRRPIARHGKGGIDFATDADLASERAVREVLREHRPDDAVVGEEYGADGSADRTWLVDPICGTLNYAAGLPLFAVNVALREGDRVRVAAVADPAVGDVFVTDGQRAWLDGDGGQLRPEPANRLVEVDASDRASRCRALLGEPDFQQRYAVRAVSTSLALSWVAAGRFAAYVVEHEVVDSVHYAAGLALCVGAGCVVTDLDGAGLGTGGRGLLAAADADVHADLLGLLAPG